MSTREGSDTYRLLESPVGPLCLVGCGRSDILHAIYFAATETKPNIPKGTVESVRAFEEAARQLREYFAGKRTEFDLALDTAGTAFQNEVWKQLQRIPFGTTISYRELAERVGRPKASRAVGGANGRNPIPIVIPCHRVIGSDGSLAGFSGGVSLKEKLLELEGVRIPDPGRQLAIKV